MEITFAPALSDAHEVVGGAAGKKKMEKKASTAGGGGDVDEDETAIELYKRKEKERRERKRLERKTRKSGAAGGGPVEPAASHEGPEFGTEDVGPGGFDDDFFADGGDDAFAAYDRADEVDGEAPGKKAKLSKRARREAKEAEEVAKAQGADALALLVADDDDDAGEGGRHFDMRQILKAEKNKGKKVRKVKGKAAADEVVKDAFDMDLGDDRFKSLHEDYDFAIDPSNPKSVFSLQFLSFPP